VRSFLLYEVWSEDADGYQELLETTADKGQALRVAKESLVPGATVTVYRETEDGDLESIEVFE